MVGTDFYIFKSKENRTGIDIFRGPLHEKSQPGLSCFNTTNRESHGNL